MKIPKRAMDRITPALRKYQPIVTTLAERDVSEADTVTVIKDMLCDLFGYDKYAELTSEQQIRGTFCDLAIKIDGKTAYLAEVKSAGTVLNESHIRQAVNYGAHNGIEWVILTNARQWWVYKLNFGQPISWDEVYSFDITQLSSRSISDIEKLYMISREAVTGSALSDFHRQSQIINRYMVAEMLMSDVVVALLRREYRRLFDNLKVSDHEIREILAGGVVKRDALDSDEAKIAKVMLKKANSAYARKTASAS